MRLTTVVGARPQFIKAATVSRVVAETPNIEESIVHTGQHYDPSLSQVFFDELGIPAPSHHLDVGSGKHGEQTGRMMARLEEVLIEERPDWLLVYGDTNSTLAGALVAAKLHIPVAHIEAGLRSFNRTMPEEVNRVLTDHVSDLLFAPTDVAVQHLRREGRPDASILKVGDVMFDATRRFAAQAQQQSRVLNHLGLEGRPYVMATIHRAENTNHLPTLRAMFEALGRLEHNVVLPLHPRTRHILETQGWLAWAHEQVQLVDPVGYLDMLMLESSAQLVVTDSGGVQKEAFFAGTPCVTLRTETEWTELVELGWNRLVDPGNADAIVHACHDALASPPTAHGTPYGDGHAAEKIVQALLTHT